MPINISYAPLDLGNGQIIYLPVDNQNSNSTIDADLQNPNLQIKYAYLSEGQMVAIPNKGYVTKVNGYISFVPFQTGQIGFVNMQNLGNGTNIISDSEASIIKARYEAQYQNYKSVGTPQNEAPAKPPQNNNITILVVVVLLFLLFLGKR